MPPALALWIALAFVFWLLRRDAASRPKLSAALWIPQIWLLVRGSRQISFWFGGGIAANSTASYVEGSPIDRLFAFALMGAALFVLQRRRLDWGSLISRNKALCVLFLYFGLSALWSDYTFVSFKRWIKEMGSVVILLVLLTESDPILAIKTVFVRCACVCFPLSIPLYKYYPAIGRAYGMGGGQQITGVTGQKNELGEICAVFGLILLWELLEIWKRKAKPKDRMGIYSRLVVLALGAWLLVACDSQTSLMCSIVGAGILLSDRIPLLKRTPKLVVLFGLVVVPSLILGLMIYHVGNPIVETLGRDMTFTGRTKIWELVLGLQANPLLGKGFYSFWLGDAAEKMWGEFSTITTAHSGYVETYLDGGYVGVFVLVIALAVVGWKLAGEFLRGTMFGRVRFMFWVMAVMLNFSESSFFRLTPMWLAFLVMALDVPQPAMVPSVVDADEVVVSKATVVA